MPIWRKTRFLVLEALFAPPALLPRRAGLAIFGLLGDCAYWLFPGTRLQILANTRLVFPDWSEARRRRFAHDVFRSLMRNAFDFFRLSRYSLAAVERLVDIEGVENLERARRPGIGVVVLAAHLGCWELSPYRVRAAGYSTAVVYRRLRDATLDDFVTSRRRRFDIEAHERDTGARGMLRSLRRGALLGVLVDQHTRVDSVQAPFLGHEAWTPTGAVQLAQRTGAPMVPMTIMMRADGRHLLRIGPEIALVAAPDGASDEEAAACMRANVARGNAALGEMILAAPEQWVWFHRRWRDK